MAKRKSLRWEGLVSTDGSFVIGRLTEVKTGREAFYLQDHPNREGRRKVETPRPCPDLKTCKAQAVAMLNGELEAFERERNVEVRRMRAERAMAEAEAMSERAKALAADVDP